MTFKPCWISTFAISKINEFQVAYLRGFTAALTGLADRGLRFEKPVVAKKEKGEEKEEKVLDPVLFLWVCFLDLLNFEFPALQLSWTCWISWFQDLRGFQFSVDAFLFLASTVTVIKMLTFCRALFSIFMFMLLLTLRLIHWLCSCPLDLMHLRFCSFLYNFCIIKALAQEIVVVSCGVKNVDSNGPLGQAVQDMLHVKHTWTM